MRRTVFRTGATTFVQITDVWSTYSNAWQCTGTTATANDRVIRDIRQQFGDFFIQRGPLMRETLALQTMQLPTKTERLAWLVDHINDLPGTGIIYTLTKRDANQVATWLKEHGVSAEAYYSDVRSDDFQNSDSYRQHLEQRLLDNDMKALVATTALGMGYDKPDLGFVVHYQAPSSVVAGGTGWSSSRLRDGNLDIGTRRWIFTNSSVAVLSLAKTG